MRHLDKKVNDVIDGKERKHSEGIAGSYLDRDIVDKNVIAGPCLGH